MAAWRKIRQRVRRNRRLVWAIDNWPAFRHGYYAALDDIERTGTGWRPMTTDARRRCADRAMKRLVDEGAVDG